MTFPQPLREHTQNNVTFFDLDAVEPGVAGVKQERRGEVEAIRLSVPYNVVVCCSFV